MLKLCVYVPESHLDAVKSALFEAGAGKIGNYDCCCWQTQGQGQFRPLSGGNPTIGHRNKVERVIAWKVEMVCAEEYLDAVLTALKQAHPYETPAFDVITLKNI